MPLPPLAVNVVAGYGTPTVPAGKVLGPVMIRPVVTLTLSVTVIDSESTMSGNVSVSATVMVSLSATTAGWPEALLMVKV